MKTLIALFACSTIVMAALYLGERDKNNLLKDQYAQCENEKSFYKESVSELTTLANDYKTEAFEAQKIAKDSQTEAVRAQAIAVEAQDLVDKYSALINSR